MLTGTEILTCAEMRAIESAAMASGAVTGLALMARAGAAVAGQIRLRWPVPGRAVVLCGPGNNGGDGYVVARLLHDAGWRVRVLGLAGTPGPDAAEMRRLWREIGPIAPLTEAELRRDPADLYVDAIFGTGLTRAPEGEIAAILHHMGGGGGDGAHFRDRVVAVDCPSGLCMDSGAFLGRARAAGDFDLHARLTVAFDSPKPGHLLERGPACCGALVIADIGIAPWREGGDGAPRPATLTAAWPDFAIPDARHIEGEAAKRAAWLTKRDAGGGHKFSHGHALIVSGGVARGGAARLAARGALRIGAGLVTLAPPRAALIDGGPPDALMRRGVDDAEALRDLLGDGRITAVCLGPGCGVDRAAALLPALLASQRPCVLDADAITALAGNDLTLHENCVLTPHAGEFARLFPDIAARLFGPRAPGHDSAPDTQTGPLYSRVDAAREAAARTGAVVLLKGPDTVIAEPPPKGRPDLPGRGAIHSAFDIPWLATAGAGDVLAGIIAGLLARGLPPFDAAVTGAWLHAAAARAHGPGLIADDLPEALPGVLAALPG